MTPRKTATEIKDAIITQLETSLNQTIPLFPKAFNRLLAKILGGVFVLLYQFAGFILLQLFVKTASNKPITVGGITLTPLQLWGELVGIFQKLGQQAEHTVDVPVLVQGGTLPSGTRVINPATQRLSVTVGDVALDAATVSATVRDVLVGELGNVDIGETLQFVSPPSDIEKDATVTARTVDGVDKEDTETFRQRILERFAFRPQGGAYADYREWAQEVAGVKRAYPFSGWELGSNHPEDGPTRGCGEVFVFVESEADSDGVPTMLGTGGRPPDPEVGGILQDVFDAIEADGTGLASRRPINDFIRIFPIHAEPWTWTGGGRTIFNVVVNGLAWVADTDAVQTSIEDALEEYFYSRENFITGLDIPPRRDIITETAVGGVAGQIAAANGGAIGGIEVRIASTPGTPRISDGVYYLSEGERVKIGTVTWS